MPKTTYSIDATNKNVGRIATEVALRLQGKHGAEYRPHIGGDAEEIIVVKNISKMRFSGKKLQQKQYYRHSGYIGGLKAKTAKDLMANDSEDVLRRAVWGMLPKTRLRKDQIKRLQFES